MANKTTENKKPEENADSLPKQNESDETFDFDTEFEKKIKLSDGSDEYIYSRGPKYSEEFWPIQCFLCRIGRIINEKKFQSHTKNPKHVENLEKAIKEPPNAEEFRQPYEQVYSDRMNMFKNPIKIYPGETIAELTTDYADRLIKMKDFLWDMPPAEGFIETLKSDIIMDFNQKSPILGLCYGFKMVKDKKIVYHCGICDTELTELNAYQHFNGKEHFKIYVDKHFPETMKKLSEINGITEDQKATIIRSIYQKLENWKGHRPFYLVNGKGFDAIKDRFIQRANRIYHYCDTTIIFSESELKEMFEKIKKRQMIVPTNPERLSKQPKSESELTELPADVEEELPNIDEIVKKDNANRGDKIPKSRKRRNKNRNRNKKEEPEKKARVETEQEKRNKRLRLDDSPSNWARYRDLCNRAIQSLNNEYERFSMVSERHPKYREEWTNFWNIKTRELRRERINPNNYNFMPEWNEYWMQYLQECFKKDASKCKFEFRKNLRLPFRDATPEPPNIFEGCKFSSVTDGGIKFGSQNNNNNNNNDNINTNKVQSGPVPLMSVGSIFGSFDGGNKNQNKSPSLPTQQSQQQQQQPMQQNSLQHGNQSTQQLHQSQQPQQQQQRNQQQQSQQSQQQSKQGQQNVANKDNTPTSVMSVLRILTALENELGSLGPTANQLLGKAILYEKEAKQSANELLHETEYFSLFATSLEKLRGLLSANLIPDIKVNATKNCVTDLEKILNLFEEYLRRNPEAAKNHVQSSIILRKRQFPSSESNNATPNITGGNITSNDNNTKIPPSNEQKNMNSNVDKWPGNQNQSNFNNKWNNDSEMGRPSGNMNRMGGNTNNYDRPNSGQSERRGNFDNNSGNMMDRRNNMNNNNYNDNNRSGNPRNDFQSNQRNMMNNQRNNDQWDNGNYNQRYSRDNYNNNNNIDNNMKGNDRYDRDYSNKNNQRDFQNNNNQRNDNDRFNTNQRGSGFNQNNPFVSGFNQRDSGNFNNREGNNNKDDFNRNMNNRDNFNRNNNASDNFYQRNNNSNFGGQKNAGNYGQRNMNEQNWNANNQNPQQKNLPSLLNNNFGGGNNFSSQNYGGRNFTRR